MVTTIWCMFDSLCWELRNIYHHHPQSKKRKSSKGNSASIHPYGRYGNAGKTSRTISTIAVIWPVKAVFEERAAMVEVDTFISPFLCASHTKPLARWSFYTTPPQLRSPGLPPTKPLVNHFPVKFEPPQGPPAVETECQHLCPTGAQQSALQMLISHWRCKKNTFPGKSACFFLGGGGVA